MRSLSVTNANLTERIKNSVKDTSSIPRVDGVFVKTYEDLVKEIAELSYLNPDSLLFFRGQAIDYKNRSSTTTIYPSIYREERITKNELKYKLDVLSASSSLLVERLESQGVIGNQEIKRKKQIQWSILQHYEVCPTPLLDITHSLRVACSFSMLNNTNECCYIYVFALPYITGRISINSEHDLINIRLLSISPPQALRPFFQEGYLVGTEFICDEYENKMELDFNRRLLAKYKIPNSNIFWGDRFNKIDEKLLYPEGDIINVICKQIKDDLNYKVSAGNQSIGNFLLKWNRLEEWIRSLGGGQYNTAHGLKYLQYNNQFDNFNLNRIYEARKFRNKVIHEPHTVKLNELHEYDSMLENLYSSLEEYNNLDRIKDNVG